MCMAVSKMKTRDILGCGFVVIGVLCIITTLVRCLGSGQMVEDAKSAEKWIIIGWVVIVALIASLHAASWLVARRSGSCTLVGDDAATLHELEIVEPAMSIDVLLDVLQCYGWMGIGIASTIMAPVRWLVPACEIVGVVETWIISLWPAISLVIGILQAARVISRRRRRTGGDVATPT